MKKIKNILFAIAMVFACSLVSVESNAQCPMCKMSAEQNLKDGGTAGKGLNKGIFMMLAMPYLLVGTIGILWYRNRRLEE